MGRTRRTPSRSTTSAAHPLSTASASKRIPTSVGKTTYWILSPPSSSTCQWGSPFFSIQPYFHCPAVWLSDIVQLHSTVYYIPSSTLTLSFYKISHRETFVNSLTVYWHHLRKIYAFYVLKKK